MLDRGFYNMDCMEGMSQFPDGYFDLAVVDPPYGIGIGHKVGSLTHLIGGGRDYLEESITVGHAAKTDLAKKTFITRSTTAPRRTRGISRSCGA